MDRDGHAPQAIPYIVRRSPRRRRTIEITVGADQQVRVAAPLHAPAAEIDAFVRRRAGWIRRQLAESKDGAPPRRLAGGERMPYLGRDYLLRVTDGARPDVRLAGPFLQIALPVALDGAGRARQAGAALERWYRARAAELIAERALLYAGRLGVEPAAVRLSNARRQWGSCSPKGVVRVSWRLVMAPLEVLDYVVVHELCHLRWRGHRVRFWSLVRSVLPGYEAHRAHLRRHGSRYQLPATGTDGGSQAS